MHSLYNFVPNSTIPVFQSCPFTARQCVVSCLLLVVERFKCVEVPKTETQDGMGVHGKVWITLLWLTGSVGRIQQWYWKMVLVWLYIAFGHFRYKLQHQNLHARYYTHRRFRVGLPNITLHRSSIDHQIDPSASRCHGLQFHSAKMSYHTMPRTNPSAEKSASFSHKNSPRHRFPQKLGIFFQKAGRKKSPIDRSGM